MEKKKRKKLSASLCNAATVMQHMMQIKTQKQKERQEIRDKR